MNANRIRGFLLRTPKPHRVRVTGDGEPQEIVMGRTAFAKHAETIVALKPELLECLDSEGKLLRALDFSSDEAHRSDAAAIPAALATDPNALMLTHFANLIHRAYEHSTDVAFQRLLELTERLGDRSEGIEARLERTEAMNRRMYQDQVDDAFARADEAAARAGEESGGQAFQSELLRMFMGGAFGAGVRPPATTNGASAGGNGKSAGAGAGTHTNGKPAPKA